MAVQSDVKSCLMWETERPYADRPRKSTYFSLFGEEWYFRIFIHSPCSRGIYCYVCLQGRNGEKSLDAPITTTCHVITNSNFTLQNYVGFNDTRSIQKSSATLFEKYLPKDSVSSSHYSVNWIVLCRFSCEKPLTFQMNNETIHLSTVKEEIQPPMTVDKSIQATPEIAQDFEGLSADISTLLQDEFFPDFKLKCRDQIFPVHRSVLAARSEVFRAMFRNPMQENKSGSVDIEDLEVPVLETLLRFVYSGRLELVSEDTISKIYEAADKYAVHSLKMACSDWMMRNMGKENCVAFLDVAYSHCDHDLRASVVSFLLKHPGVLKTTPWLTFSKQHQELANEILQMCVSSIAE